MFVAISVLCYLFQFAFVCLLCVSCLAVTCSCDWLSHVLWDVQVGGTPLHYAAQRDSAKTAGVLLEHKADCNATDNVSVK